MRLPHLQVAQESWAKARELAALLGINRHHAMGLLLDLWAWALELGPADEPPEGKLSGPNTLKRMAGALEFPGLHAVELADALQDVGLLEWSTEGAVEHLRVKGMDRYLATFKKRQSDRERQALGRTSQRPRGDIEATSKRVGGSDADADADIDRRKEKPLSAEPPTPAVRDLQAAWNDIAKPAGLPGWNETPPKRQKAASARLRDNPDLQHWREVIRRVTRAPFLRGENDRGWRASPDWLLKPESAAKVLEGAYDGAPRVSNGRASESDKDWSQIPVTEYDESQPFEGAAL